jgi:RNA polymerase sigma-70 factor (ECF subfamily)
MSDSQLAQSPQARHEEFVTLLTASHEKLLGYLMSLLGRWHDAQDVLQRASLLMWQKFATFESGSDFVAWASTICFYESKNFQRLAARSSFQFDDNLLNTLALERLDDLAQHERRMNALEQCLQQFAEAERQMLRAAYVGHGGITVLAGQMNRAPRTLYNKLNHLRRLLAECVLRRLAEENA